MLEHVPAQPLPVRSIDISIVVLLNKHETNNINKATRYAISFDNINYIHCLFNLQEQDKSSDIEQQPPFGDRKISNIQPQNRAGVQNQQEHHIILTKYEAVHPTAVSKNYSSSGMLII